ncbi:MAG: 3-phosphoshikimate 1-carboxyvinyltransferase, partial [Bacteroidia bacterium]
MIKVYHPSRKLEGTIDLPSSKSISNRMLLLQKLYEPDLCIENLSDANDTQLLSELLKADKKIVNVQDAGTAYRFMVAYCACTAGEWLIDGSPRLRERPIGGLVDSLRILGADIEYLGEKGQAPLRIRGGDLVAKHEVLDLSEVKSSQFVSAILLISPKIQGDFRVKIKRNMPSMSYVQLTISCMRRMGFSIWKKDNVIEVSKHKKFDGEHFIVEPDWTSFFYWLSMVHLSKESNLFFPQLRLDSMQKERKLLFEVGNRSIHFEEQKGGLRIIKKGDN